MAIPNFRNKDERDAWRNDNKCTNPSIASGEDLLPGSSKGDYGYTPEVFDKVKKIWLVGQNK